MPGLGEHRASPAYVLPWLATGPSLKKSFLVHPLTWSLVVSCALFLLVAGQFFAVTPILESPDALAHYNYVRSLAVFHRFPRLGDPDLRHSARQEAAQFPLYYLVAAAVSAPVPTADIDRVVMHNPSGGSHGSTNRNGNYHRPFSGFPTGTELAVRIVELFSLACGVATVVCTVLLARLFDPDRPSLWLAAGCVL
ncbi:MAG: hypothetical protein ACYDAG_05345, partial [Chloroflexota bacterium]